MNYFPIFESNYIFISMSDLVKYTGSISSFVLVSLAASLLFWSLKKRHLKLVEVNYYKLLQHHIASTVGRESLKKNYAKELARASNKLFKRNRVGTVFKGTLSDGTLVAIKNSNQAFNLEDDHEFLNEVTILSQINHKNILSKLNSLCWYLNLFPMEHSFNIYTPKRGLCLGCHVCRL